MQNATRKELEELIALFREQVYEDECLEDNCWLLEDKKGILSSDKKVRNLNCSHMNNGGISIYLIYPYIVKKGSLTAFVGPQGLCIFNAKQCWYTDGDWLENFEDENVERYCNVLIEALQKETEELFVAYVQQNIDTLISDETNNQQKEVLI